MIHASINRLTDPLRATPDRVFIISFGILLLSAATSFLVHEYGVAHHFGFPLDTGWLDIVTGRHVLRGEAVTSGSESPAYALILGVIDLLGHGNATFVAIVAKTLSLAAFIVTGWACFRLVQRFLGDGTLGVLTVVILVSLSPALVWSGTSGLGIAWGTAMIALGFRDFADNRHVAGTAWLGVACWFTPIALPILLMSYSVRLRTGTLLRIAIGAAAISGWIAWRLVSGTSIMVPLETSDWLTWGANWLSLVGAARVGYVHPPLLALLVAIGVFRLRRQGLALIAIVVVPAVVVPIIEPNPGAFGRLIFPILPVVFGLATAGIDLIATRQSHGLLRGRRLAIALLAMYIVWVGPTLWMVRTIFAWQVENTVRAGVDVGRWIGENANHGELIATTAPGAVGYFSQHVVIDLTRVRDIDEAIMITRPPWVAVNVSLSIPDAIREDYEAVHTTAFRVRTSVYPPGPLVVFRRMYRAGMATTTPQPTFTHDGPSAGKEAYL
ncbi:MAG TPA: hypothetical protein ENN56_00330, partial [Firmicutes bacterium]|nr:hypothetical protein [Bacillota bacterium]